MLTTPAMETAGTFPHIRSLEPRDFLSSFGEIFNHVLHNFVHTLGSFYSYSSYFALFALLPFLLANGTAITTGAEWLLSKKRWRFSHAGRADDYGWSGMHGESFSLFVKV